MPKCRSKNRDKAFEIFKEHDGKITNRKIAEILGEKENTISNWKCKDKWNVVLRKNDCSTTIKNKRKRGGQPGKCDTSEKDVEQVTGNADLSDKQRLFCLLYIRCFNATKAYQKAYECDYVSAMQNGSRMLRNDKVKEEILRLKQNRLNREMLDEADVFQWYLDIARADIKDYVEFGNEEISVVDKLGREHRVKISNVNIKNDSEVDGILISEISKGKDGVKVKLPDKLKAMEWIADHMDLATDEQKARIEQMKANTDRLRRDSPDEEEDGVEIVNDTEKEKAGKDIGDHHTEVPEDIQ